jgi:site-specific recombinase XerD
MDSATASGKIKPEEKHLIQLFISEVGAIRQITTHRKYAIATALLNFKEYIQDYRTCNTEDIFISIEQYRSSSDHAESYQKVLLSIYKRFLLWLYESEYNTTLNPTKLLKISVKTKPVLKTADDILTPTELQLLFEATKSLRDRALLEVLYESMGRIGEVATLKWRQITFHNTHATITLDSKTGIPRKVPLYTSPIYLKHWMDHYPSKAAPEKYVFQTVNSGGKKCLTYSGVKYLIKDLQKAAGITKNVTPHIFRHTRITDLMRMGTSEQTIKLLAWGTVTTDMLRVYAHLTPTDAENELNRIMGITKTDKMAALAEIVTPVQCVQCGLINPKSNRFCGECGTSLSTEYKDKHEQIVQFLQNDKIREELIQLLLSKM